MQEHPRAVLAEGADTSRRQHAEQTDREALPPGLLGRTELSLLASRAAIALDGGIHDRAIDLRPIRQLGAVLASGLGQSVDVSTPDQAKLADPETTELLSRLPTLTGHGSDDPGERGQAAAHDFVAASMGDASVLASLGKPKLIELRDFSIGLSIAARSPRSAALLGYLRQVG
ncbi:MAG: hypothetical protein JWM41_2042 [Gemmatimonadetes bacterium]|nr:hypothetical protein [Gemmatimonadota bacterium]